MSNFKTQIILQISNLKTQIILQMSNFKTQTILQISNFKTSTASLICGLHAVVRVRLKGLSKTLWRPFYLLASPGIRIPGIRQISSWLPTPEISKVTQKRFGFTKGRVLLVYLLQKQLSIFVHLGFLSLFHILGCFYSVSESYKETVWFVWTYNQLLPWNLHSDLSSVCWFTPPIFSNMLCCRRARAHLNDFFSIASNFVLTMYDSKVIQPMMTRSSSSLDPITNGPCSWSCFVKKVIVGVMFIF